MYVPVYTRMRCCPGTGEGSAVVNKDGRQNWQHAKIYTLNKYPLKWALKGNHFEQALLILLAYSKCKACQTNYFGF